MVKMIIHHSAVSVHQGQCEPEEGGRKGGMERGRKGGKNAHTDPIGS